MDISTIDNRVRQVVSNIRNLPTPPIVFQQIQKVMSDPNVSANHIANILAEDPAMSVKVLKLTNSAFYGLAREIDSVKHAVVIVGLEAIKNLVLSASVMDMFKGKQDDQDFHDKYWRHSLAAGFCGKILAKKLRARGLVNPDSAFSGGLLHDIGKIVICSFLPDEYALIKSEREKDQESADYQIEEKVLGYNHAQIGGILAEQWKLPERLTEAITYHHHPQLSELDDPIVYVIHIADYVAKKTFYIKEDQYLVGELDPQIMDYMQVSEDDLESYGENLREEYLKSETFMQMAGLSS